MNTFKFLFKIFEVISFKSLFLESCDFNSILNISSIVQLIYELNNKKKIRKPKYIIFSDNLVNKYCSDINAYTVFEYFIKNNDNNAYYIINIFSDLYQTLLEQNKTKNLLLYNKKNYNSLFEFFLNSKIIVSSYENDFYKILNKVSYLKFLYINHGITYFKSDFVTPELKNIQINKRNIICSSPFEYSILLNKFNYSNNYIFKAGLARYDMYNKPKRNRKRKKCILAFFTYRKYNNNIFKNSSYKTNIFNLLNDKQLIQYLKKNKISLIFAQHHVDKKKHKIYRMKFLKFAKIVSHMKLTNYISKCSLLITDFSSISFAFMFQNKPVLFYLVDYKNENKNYYKINDPLQFGQYYIDKYELIKKIKYYIRNNFTIPKELKNGYNSIFYYKNNITERIAQIINEQNISFNIDYW